MDCIQSHKSPLICQGDICVIYISESIRNILKIEPNEQLTTKFGVIKAMDLIDHPFGVKYNCKKGWVMPLRLTPELWTQLLPHRTQILYHADISMILLCLDIKPGSLVVESGTGSGSLSHAILRACRPNGFLYTFEINESRVQVAKEEFDQHGFGGSVKVSNRDVCELGFDDDLMNSIDACILDLPQTWNAIKYAYKVMKPVGSRLCTFSPCIEQVQRNVAMMEDLKLKDIVTYETLLRPFDVRTQTLRVWDEEVLEGLAAIDKKRITNLKNTLDPTKKAKISENNGQSSEPESEQESDEKMTTLPEDKSIEPLTKALTDPKAPFNNTMLPKKTTVSAKHFNESVGHSGYLTFATKRP